VARFFAAHCVAAHQQVGRFEVVNQFGTLQKNGGNVASYFCTPTGRVVHAVAGPAPAADLLAAARWAVEVTSDGKASDSAEQIGAAHRKERERLEKKGDTSSAWQIHRLLGVRPLPKLGDVYRPIVEDIVGQSVSLPGAELAEARRALSAARASGLPVLLILHKEHDNQRVLERWTDLVARARGGDGGSLAGLANSYVVIALPLNELPALSHQLGIPPYAAPDRGSPLFVIARSDGRQLSAVTTWSKTDELAYAMAQGLVQEAKEHERTPNQLDALLSQIGAVDQDLAGQLRKLMADLNPGARRQPGRFFRATELQGGPRADVAN
jgi:hypothetical protein